jgi:hypothetical protein
MDANFQSHNPIDSSEKSIAAAVAHVDPYQAGSRLLRSMAVPA